LIKLRAASVNPLDLFLMKGAPWNRVIPGLRTPKHEIIGRARRLPSHSSHLWRCRCPSWDGSAELRARLLAAVGKITVPVLLIHTANDYSVTPGKSMAAEFARLSKPRELKLYPPVGQTASDGHNFLYTDVALWEEDVF
jgi:pimeloyl-ACP methyl ester carboxylesterase